jgi:hypothetical protein
MKKDLSLQKKKTAEAVAQTHLLLDQLKKHMKQHQLQEQSLAKTAPISNTETSPTKGNVPMSNGTVVETVPSPVALESPIATAETSDKSLNPVMEGVLAKSNGEVLIPNGDAVKDTVSPVVEAIQSNEDAMIPVALKTVNAVEETVEESKEQAMLPKEEMLESVVSDEARPAETLDAIAIDISEHTTTSLAPTIPTSPSDDLSDRTKDHPPENGVTPLFRMSILTEEYDDSEHKTDDPESLVELPPSEMEPSANLVSSDDYESNEENDGPSDDMDVVPADPLAVDEDANQPSSMLRPVTPVGAVEASNAVPEAEGTPTAESPETAAVAAWFDEEYDEAGDTYDAVLGLSSPAKKEYFPHSASPKIHLRYPPAGANEKFEDEFPGDIIPPKIVHPHFSAKKKDPSSLAPLDEQWSSIDAFEASFQSPFSFEESPASDPFRVDSDGVVEGSISTNTSSDLPPLESNRGIRERATAAFQRNNRHDANATVPRTSARWNSQTEVSPTKSLAPLIGNDVAPPKSSPPSKTEVSPTKSTPPSSSSKSDQSARWLQEIRASTEKKKVESPLESERPREDHASAISPLFAVPHKPKDSSSSTAEPPTPVFRQFPRSPVQPSNPVIFTEMDSTGDSSTSPPSLKQNLPLESPRNTVASARSRYVEAVSSERGRSTTRALAVTIPSPPSQKSPENGSGSSVNVRERAALYSKASPSSSSTPSNSSQWRPISRSTVKLLDDEGDIPMQTSLSPRKYRSEALTPSSETFRTTTSASLRGRRNGFTEATLEEERYPGGDARAYPPGRVQATIFDREDSRRAGKQRRHINLSGGRLLRNGEQEVDSRYHPEEI